MALRKTTPVRWQPKGCSDTLDTTELFPGAMNALVNLVPDPTTANLWVPRPASTKLTSFAQLFQPGFVSCLLVVGTRVYGTIASNDHPGYDVPFSYNLLSNTFDTISGITISNLPSQLPTTGAWVPPVMALVGVYVVLAHSGFPGGPSSVGFLNISNVAAPVWTSGNTSPNALPSVPVAVAQFNGRAFYVCNPASGQPSVVATDVLLPSTTTNATYVLTFGDNVPLTTAIGLPLANQLGGVIGSLMVFKDERNIYQITGDFANSTIAVNALNAATGAVGALAMCTTPKGIAFIAPDGLRFIDFNARVSDPIGIAGQGVSVPFTQITVPSRVCVASNATAIRISCQNGAVAGSPQQEWVYDLARQVWHGPHTFAASLIQPYGTSFIKTPLGVTASLWQSDIVPNTSSTYTENGVPLTFLYQTALFPDGEMLATYQFSQSTIHMGYGTGSPNYSVTAEDQNGFTLGAVTLTPPTTVSYWGTATWGTSLWGGTGGLALQQRPIDWTAPVVFNRCSISIAGPSAAGVRIGDFYARWQVIDYLPTS